MKILIDTREQAPYSFQGKYYQDVKIEHGTLQSGDYSLAGLTDKIAVERKELPDLIQCLGREEIALKESYRGLRPLIALLLLLKRAGRTLPRATIEAS